MLKLVAPISMSAEAQAVWITAAADALEDIRADEVRDISAEVRRSITRPSQIVPEIAKLVADKRQRSQNGAVVRDNPVARELDIAREAQSRRFAASHDRRKLSEAWEWERQARIDAGLAVRPRPLPFTREELDAMPGNIRKMGLNYGFLTYEGGKLVEAAQ